MADLTAEQKGALLAMAQEHGTDRAFDEAYRLGWQARGKHDQDLCHSRYERAGHSPSGLMAAELLYAIARADQGEE